MAGIRVATTINPRFDHVTPIESTRSAVTITHRCQVFAELMAVARSGIVDIVLIADDFDLVSSESLHQLLHDEGHEVKIAAISDIVDERDRLTDLGIPVASPQFSADELIQWLEEIHGTAPAREVPEEFSADDIRVLQSLDPEAPPKRRSGRRAAPYDAAKDHREPLESSSESLPAKDNQQTATPDVERPAFEEHDETSAIEFDDGQPGQITAVWGPIGSPGVTTIAVNLAAESALAGHRTILLDANTYGAAVSVHLGLLDDTAAIAQACRAAEHRGMSAPDLRRYVQRVTVQGSDIDVLTGLTRVERWPQIRATAWERVLEAARSGWDHVIIDCGFGLEQDEELSFDIPAPQRNATTISAVTTADTVVAVGTGDPVGLARFMKGIEQLTETGPRSVVPVLNKVTSMTSGLTPKRQISGVWDRFGPKVPLEHFLSWAPEVTAAALFEAKTLAERAPKAELRNAIRQLLHACVPVKAVTTTPGRTSPDEDSSTKTLRRVVSQVKERIAKSR